MEVHSPLLIIIYATNRQTRSAIAFTTGSGKNGQWKKQDIIVETDGQYPKKYVSLFGEIK